MRKKGYLQTLEAVIVVVVIVTVIIGFKYSENKPVDTPVNVKSAQKFILKSALSNYDDVIVNAVMGIDPSDDIKIIGGGVGNPPTIVPPTLSLDGLKTNIDSNIPAGYDYIFQICKILGSNSLCVSPNLPNKLVYLDTNYLADKDNPRLLKLYICEKSCVA